MSESKKREKNTPKYRAIVRFSVLIGLSVGAIFLNCAWAQPSYSYADIYAKLDQRIELGEGVVGARQRPKVDPNTVHAIPARETEKFEGKSVRQFRDGIVSDFKQVEQRIQEASRKQLEALNEEVRKTCDSDRFEPAVVGMTEKRFLSCSLEGRMGPITHIVSVNDADVSAKLYVLGAPNVQKIYVVNGFIRTMLAPVASAPLPALHDVTQYPERYFNPYIVALAAGDYFVFGQDQGEDWGLPADQAVKKLADSIDRIHTTEEPPPLQWSAKQQGWLRVPRSPQCSGYWYLHTLSVLPDSRVLVAGGLCDIPRLLNEMGTFEPHLATSIWNPKTRAWDTAPKLRQARIYHTATVLSDGSVMLLGGLGDPLHTSPQEPLDSAESLSGVDNFPLNSMAHPRAKHSATLLADGSVMAIGGQGHNAATLSSVEIWNSLSRNWETRAPMLTPRYAHTTTLMLDGRILVAGGIGAQGEALNTTEFFDSQRNTWSPGPPLPQHLQSHNGTLLADGTVVLAGGLIGANGQHQPWLHILYPGQSQWQKTGTRLTSMTNYGLSHRTLIVPSAAGNALLFANDRVFYWRNPALPERTAPVGGVQTGEPKMPDDVPLMSARLLSDQDARALTVTPDALPVRLDQQTAKSRWSHFVDTLRVSPILLPLIGVLLVMLLIVIFKRRSKKQSIAAATTSPAMKWFVRLVIYGGLLVFGIPNLLAYFAITSQVMSDECRAHPGACLDNDRHLMKQTPGVPDESKSARPRIPCAFVGVWESKFKDLPLRFELNSDGTYRMKSPSPSLAGNDAGHWVIQGKFMVWSSTLHHGNDADINRIVSNDGQHFELVETNGIHSHFGRIEDLPKGNCESGK